MSKRIEKLLRNFGIEYYGTMVGMAIFRFEGSFFIVYVDGIFPVIERMRA